MRWYSLLCLGLIATVGFTGCGGKGDKAPAATTVSIPSTPDGTVTAVAGALAEGKFEALWQAMPETYRADINGQIEHFAEHVDGDVWAKSMSLVGKLAEILETKQDLILGSAMVAPQLKKQNINPEDAKATLTQLGGLLNDIQKDVKTKDDLAKLNVEKYLANLGSRAKSMEPLFAKTQGEDQFKMEDLKKVTATVKDSTADTATVEVKMPDGKVETKKMAKVQGKWVPQEMADDWKKNIKELDSMLHNVEMNDEQKKQFMEIANTVDGVLDSLLKAKDQAAFDTAIGEAMGKAGSMLGFGGMPALN
jgi:hypothetical protein